MHIKIITGLGLLIAAASVYYLVDRFMIHHPADENKDTADKMSAAAETAKQAASIVTMPKAESPYQYTWSTGSSDGSQTTY